MRPLNATPAEVELNKALVRDVLNMVAALEDMYSTGAPYIADSKHREEFYDHFQKVSGSLNILLHGLTSARSMGCVKEPSESEDGTGNLYDAKA